MISVSEYYKRFIDSKVDLNDTPKVCCPFHKEEKPSFSYDSNRGRWRCFGSCKVGGDVIDLHRKHYNLRSRKESEESLYRLLGIHITHGITSLKEDYVVIDEEKLSVDVAYEKAVIYANTKERWIKLDYVMSVYPLDVTRLEDLLKKWGVAK